MVWLVLPIVQPASHGSRPATRIKGSIRAIRSARPGCASKASMAMAGIFEVFMKVAFYADKRVEYLVYLIAARCAQDQWQDSAHTFRFVRPQGSSRARI